MTGMTDRIVSNTPKLSMYCYRAESNIEAIQEYAENRRERWMDHSIFCCSKVGCSHYAPSLLDKVITKIFSRDLADIGELYITKRGQYTLLDFTVFEMIRTEIKTFISPRDYIQERYHRWLDFSDYHCGTHKMQDEAIDVLNEVLYSLLKKDETWLFQMCNKSQGGYKALDFYVLRMIKLNIISPTSPYQSKYKNRFNSSKIDRINFSTHNIVDKIEDVHDYAAEHLKHHRLIIYVFKRLRLTDLEFNIFEHCFLNDESLNTFSSSSSKQQCRNAYNTVIKVIQLILFRQALIKEQPEFNPKSTRYQYNRVEELVNEFFINRKIIIRTSNN